jgi:hypothetical protein
MKRNVTLTITSLLSILLFTFHLSDDIVRGFEPGGFKNIGGVLTLVGTERWHSPNGDRGTSSCSSAPFLGRSSPSRTCGEPDLSAAGSPTPAESFSGSVRSWHSA